jgi:acyl dehydratase
VRVITGLEALRKAEGETLGTSAWHEVTQADVDRFAALTGDAAYYILTLSGKFYEELLDFEGFAFGLNYGLDRVRFPNPVPVGGKVRGTFALTGVEDIPGGAQVKLELTVEREGGDTPVCVAVLIARLYTDR